MHRHIGILVVIIALLLGIGYYLGWLDNGKDPYKSYLGQEE